MVFHENGILILKMIIRLTRFLIALKKDSYYINMQHTNAPVQMSFGLARYDL